MKNLVKNENDLLTPYSEALCHLPRCQIGWICQICQIFLHSNLSKAFFSIWSLGLGWVNLWTHHFELMKENMKRFSQKTLSTIIFICLFKDLSVAYKLQKQYMNMKCINDTLVVELSSKMIAN